MIRKYFEGAAIVLATAVAFPAAAQTTIAAPPASAASVATTPQPQVPPLPANVAALVAAPTVSVKPGVGLSPDEFGKMVNESFPLNPAQVKVINRQTDAVSRASKARVGKAPEAVTTTIRVSLAPGATPPVVRIDYNAVTTLVFNDVTGAPWRVIGVSAPQGLLDIPKKEELTARATNMFTVAPMDYHVSTNMTVFLEGAPAPVTMLVATDQPQVDLRADMSIQARGPGAVMPVISRGLTESVPAELTSMVSGLTPSNAKPLKVISSDFDDVQAWTVGDRMYIRSRADVLAPPVPKDGKVATGPDGTKVYQLPLASEVLLMQGGSVGHLHLGGFPPPTIAQLAAAAGK